MTATSIQATHCAAKDMWNFLCVREDLKELGRRARVNGNPLIGFGSALGSFEAKYLPVQGCGEGAHFSLQKGVSAITLRPQKLAVNATKLLLHSSVPRCVACGRLQGDPHAGGCKYAPFTIRRAS